MMDFSPGDLVVIRDYEDMAEQFGVDERGSVGCRFHFTEPMRKFCGMHLTVKSINERGRVLFDDPPGTMQFYSFSTDMIRHDEGSEPPEIQIEEFLSMIL